MLFGCGLFTPDIELDFAKFQDEFMSTYQLNKIVDQGTVASIRTVIPAWDADIGPSTFTSGSIENWPENGQTTSWTATLTTVTDVYFIEATTTYDRDEDANIDRTEEFYYVKDMAPLDSWGSEDLYVDATGAVDSKKRQRFRTYFADSTIRREQIVADATDGASGQYAIFDFNGTLDYDSLEIPSDTFTAGENSRWSSKVAYAHNMKDNQYWTWWGDLSRASLRGDRYYSSGMVDGSFVESYIFIESGLARNIVWSDEAVEAAPELTLDDERSALFTGVMRMKIAGGTKSIRAQYTIDARSGTYTVLVEGDSVTVE